MPKDLRITKHPATNRFELIHIEEPEGTENSENLTSCSQLGKTLLANIATGFQWTAWWGAALIANAAVYAIPGVILGAGGGYSHARWNEPCIKEPNSVAVSKCALKSSDIASGALYGALATSVVGVAVTTIGFFKGPSIKNAKKTMLISAVGVGYCCAAMGAGCSS
ncbi:MAG: hypothetical protein WA659_02500 [Candidatus Aquirickettsiella sp.]